MDSYWGWRPSRDKPRWSSQTRSSLARPWAIPGFRAFSSRVASRIAAMSSGFDAARTNLTASSVDRMMSLPRTCTGGLIAYRVIAPIIKVDTKCSPQLTPRKPPGFPPVRHRSASGRSSAQRPKRTDDRGAAVKEPLHRGRGGPHRCSPLLWPGHPRSPLHCPRRRRTGSLQTGSDLTQWGLRWRASDLPWHQPGFGDVNDTNLIISIIPLPLEDPKIGRIDDAEIVGDRIAEDGPVFRHLLAQETQNGITEVVA
jgi:hypothetical protein